MSGVPMSQINIPKRAEHRRRVQETLQQIFNDPTTMPNADCGDLVVSVSRAEFGKTVREIYIDVVGRWRKSFEPGDELPQERYLREAKARGEITYIDLTDVFTFPSLMEIVEKELQKRLGLLYAPTIRRLEHFPFWCSNSMEA